MQINLEKQPGDLKLTIMLEQFISPAGVYVNPDQAVINHLDRVASGNEAKPENEATITTVTGTTDSKLYALMNTIKAQVIQDQIVIKKVGNRFGEAHEVSDFDVKRFLNTPIQITGTDITGTITLFEQDRVEYELYSDTDLPIKYIDFSDNLTTFSFTKDTENTNPSSPLMNKFNGLVEEPKIDSSVFIDRGVVNVFEPFTKLKKVKTLNEMTKFGFGYYKINKQGFNF